MNVSESIKKHVPSEDEIARMVAECAGEAVEYDSTVAEFKQTLQMHQNRLMKRSRH